MPRQPKTPAKKYRAEAVRDKIKATQILNRLQNFALWVDDPEAYEDLEHYEKTKRQVVMTPDQIRTTQHLLDKVVPSLKAVEVNGELGVNIIRNTIYEERPHSADDVPTADHD